MSEGHPVHSSHDILDISSSSSAMRYIGHSTLEDDECNDVCNDYFESCEEDQVLVNKFLDGEMNVTEYIENVSGNADETDIFGSDFLKQEYEVNSLDRKEIIYSQGSRMKKSAARKLPPALKGLMGEANLRVAKGDKETAVQICLEIIRQIPTAPEPFLTLAGIYDEMGDQDKCLQMSLVAAHLSSTDADQWLHLAEMSEKLGNIKQAVTCYTKAINLDLTNMELHEKRAALLELLGDKKTALRGYLRLLSSLKPEQGEQIVNIAKFIAEIYHKENDIVRASAALDVAIEKCPKFINSEFVNLQLDLLLLLKSYRRCLELMVAFCDLVVEAETNEDLFVILNCSIPSDTPIDIIAKLIIVLIHMKATQLINRLIEPIVELSPSDAGDLHLDIAEAYAEEGCYSEANNLLRYLVHSDSYNLPGVWLKYAENLRKVGNVKDAIGAYYEVLKQAPQHVEARLTLASLLVEYGRTDDAISVLTESEEYDCQDVGLLYERCMLLKRDMSRAQELIMVGQVLFSRHSTQIRNKDELTTISTIQRYDRKRTAVKQIRKSKKEPEIDNDLDTALLRKDIRKPTVEEEWDLFKHICSVCVQLKMFSTFQRLTFTAQLSTVLHIYKYEIDILSVIASYMNKDSHNGYNIVRTLVVKNCLNVKLWHLFNLIVTKSDDARHNRFIMRQLSHFCDHPALGHLHGNNCLVSGTYKYAMHEYSVAYTKKPTPLGALLLGLTYLQMAAQKFTSKKHSLVIQALCLLVQYQEQRGSEGMQEVHYNLGRGFHHLGLFTPAIFHYKKALEFANLPLSREQPHIFDLSREAAFNLNLIYCQSESYDLAKMYIDKYIVV